MDIEYYYITWVSKKNGPVSIIQLRELIKNGTIHKDTLVWAEGMTTWLPLTQIIPPAEIEALHPPCPPTHMAFAIITLIFCCLPVSIFALMEACNVEQLYALGQYKRAENASRLAEKYCWWSLASFPIAGVAIALFCAFLALFIP